MIRRPASVLALLVAFLVLAPAEAAAQDRHGSPGAALVGGLTGGAAALWAFYPLSGCPMITVGAARATDGCDAGGVAAALLGLGAGVWTGATDSGAGYGIGIGALAGFGAGWLLNRVGDTPRWLDASLVVAGAVTGAILGARDDDGARNVSPDAALAMPFWSLPVR